MHWASSEGTERRQVKFLQIHIVICNECRESVSDSVLRFHLTVDPCDLARPSPCTDDETSRHACQCSQFSKIIGLRVGGQ